MKKLISMILAAAMLLSLTACGSTAADAAADDPEAETASADASAETPPEKPDGTPPDGANGQPGTPPDGKPPDGAPNGQPGSFGGGRRLLRHERRAAGDERRDRHDQKTRLSIPPRRTATAYSATAAARPSTSPIPRSRQALITPAASRPPAAARRTRKT